MLLTLFYLPLNIKGFLTKGCSKELPGPSGCEALSFGWGLASALLSITENSDVHYQPEPLINSKKAWQKNNKTKLYIFWNAVVGFFKLTTPEDYSFTGTGAWQDWWYPAVVCASSWHPPRRWALYRNVPCPSLSQPLPQYLVKMGIYWISALPSNSIWWTIFILSSHF